MPTTLQHIIWPDVPVEPEAKNLIDLFFRLVDLNDVGSGKQLAEDVFTPDGRMITANGTFIGKAEISKCRSNAWATVASRHHEIAKVFASDPSGRDLLLIGRLIVVLKNDPAPWVTEFAGRGLIVDFDGAQSKTLRLKSYQAWVGQTTKL